MFRTVGFLMFAFALTAAPAFAQGTARSLDIQPGGQRNGMGAAGGALVSRPCDALWWNPAALAFAETQAFAYTRSRLLPGLASDIIYQHVAWGGRVGERLGAGASFTNLSYGDGGNDASERSPAVAFAFRPIPELGFGVTAKHVTVDLAPFFEGSTVAADFGALYRADLQRAIASVGVSFQNVGPEMSFDDLTPSSPLSRNLKIGIAVGGTLTPAGSDWDARMTLAVDHNQSLVTDEWETWHYGAELAGGMSMFRVALRTGYYEDRLGEIVDPTWGAGIEVAGLFVDMGSIPQARDSGLENVEKWTFGVDATRLLAFLQAR